MIPHTCNPDFFCALCEKAKTPRAIKGRAAETPADTLEVQTSGMGIGDAVSGYYAACGLADATGRPVTYHSRHHLDWFGAVSHPGVRIAPHAGRGPDCNADYPGQMRAAAEKACPSRGQWLCDNLARAFGLPPFPPTRPPIRRPVVPVAGTGYTVLAPGSLTPAREWPADKWRELARQLVADGTRVIAIDRPGSEARLAGTFGGLGVETMAGPPPATAVALIANADLLVGNDSGMVHVAGLVGTPARAVMTHLTAEFVFSDAPSVTGVYADPAAWPCQGCAWQPARGFKPACRSGCQALETLGVDRVRRPFGPPRSADEVLGLVADKLGRRAKTTHWLFERLAGCDSPAVIETGCVRSREDWSAGYFTWLCGAWLEALGKGTLESIDNDARHCGVARELCRPWSRVSVTHADSVEWLSAGRAPVDVAYLDSLDTDRPGCAGHALAEAAAVEPRMRAGGVIAFDDSPAGVAGGWSGKGRMAVPWLVARGWRVVPVSDYQTLLVRGEP